MSATDKFTIIDSHVHFCEEYVFQQSLGKTVVTGFGTREAAKNKRGPVTREVMNAEVQIEDMDRDGVDINVISVATVMQGTSWAPPALDLELSKRNNDKAASWVAKYPKRFIASFVLPLQDMKLSMAEFDRCVSQSKMPAVQLPSNINGAYVGEPVFNELWDAIDQHGLVAIFHPEGIKDPWYQKYRMWNSLGQPVEEAKLISSLIYEGVLERHPKIKVIMSHGGGMLPHYMGRHDRNVYNMPDSTVNITKKPSEYLRHMYYDTCVYLPETLLALKKIVGADRLVLGSDYPVGDPDRVGFIRNNVSPDEFRMIAGGTMARLLGLGQQAAKA